MTHCNGSSTCSAIRCKEQGSPVFLVKINRHFYYTLINEVDHMIVLSRKVGEDVFIDGGRIVVRVSRILGGRVVLAFDAQDDVVIDRREVHEKRGQPVSRPTEPVITDPRPFAE